MPVESAVPQSPGWWLRRLGRRLAEDRDRLDMLWSYYSGRHPLPQVPGLRNEEYQRWMRNARANWVELVVESLRERLAVVGFRVGDEGPEGDREADTIWQRNQLDAESGLVHQAALVFGRAYVLVGVDPYGTGRQALVTPEHPTEAVTEGTPGHPRRRAAGLKVWRDDWTGRYRASLYLPEAIYQFTSDKDNVTWLTGDQKLVPWTLDTQMPNPFGAVPLVPFRNKRTMLTEGSGEFESVIDIQDRINASLINLISAMRYGAFRQRWAVGLETDKDPITGQNIEPFKLDIRKLWSVPATDVTFGEFTETRLEGYIQAAREGVKDLAAITRTPPHYLLGEVVNATGDALKAAETGLVSKALDRQTHWGESWEEVMRLAGKVEGIPALADSDSSETLWRDPESRSMAELADAALKLKTIGFPFRNLAARMGETPQEIERMVADKAAEDLLRPQPPMLPQFQAPGQQPALPPGQQPDEEQNAQAQR